MGCTQSAPSKEPPRAESKPSLSKVKVAPDPSPAPPDGEALGDEPDRKEVQAESKSKNEGGASGTYKNEEESREFFIKRNRRRMLESRTVRVFISSTFRDFALERDYLMRHALPELRQIGEKQGITVVFVDLRWGVTSEESSSGAVVKLCLQEIDACRPFFIGMLGERYGWHLTGDKGVDELLDTTMDIGEAYYPWMKPFRMRSVTELEMLHGALEEPELAGFSTFYIRKHEEFKEEMKQSIKEEDLPAFEAENEHAKKAQSKLKNEIRRLFPNNTSDYSNVKQLSDRVVQDLTKAIDAEFGIDEDKELSVWDKFELQHKAYSASRRMGYVRPKGMYEWLDGYCTSNSDNGIAVIGPSGAGKSALLANWSSYYASANPNAIVFVHYVGSTTESTNHHHVIRRIIGHLSQELDLDLAATFCESLDAKRIKEKENVAIVMDLKKQELIELFPDFMAAAAKVSKEKGKKLVLVIDALDELEDQSNAHSLYWLRKVPQTCLICSIKNEADGKTCFEYWKRKKWDFRIIEPLSDGDKEKATIEYLAEHAKRLNDTQVSLICSAKMSSNPLFLRTLLDEARLFGNFFTFTDQLKDLTSAETIEELFKKVIDRISQECGTTLTLRAIACILCARDGLRDDELRDMLQVEPKPTSEGYPDIFHDDFVMSSDEDLQHFTQLLFSLRELLCGPGLLVFAHDAVKQAVRHLINDQEGIVIAHRRLADYFEVNDTDLSPRQAREYPVHLMVSGQYDRLSAYLSKFHVLKYMMADEATKYELAMYWRESEKFWAKEQLHDEPKTAASCLGATAKAIQAQAQEMLKSSNSEDVLSQFPRHLDLISLLLVILGAYDVAVNIRQSELSLNKTIFGEVHPCVSASCCELAHVYEKVYSKYDVSMGLMQKALDIDTQILGEEHRDLAVSCENLASLHLKLGEFQKAQALYMRALKIKEKHDGKEHRSIAITVSQIGLMYEEIGKYEEATKWCERGYKIREHCFGPAHPSVARSLIDLAMLNLKQGGGAIREKALPQLEEGMSILKSLLGENHTDVAAACNNIGLIYSELGEYSMALKYHKEAAVIQSAQLGDDHPSYAATCTNIGSVCQELAEQAFSKGENLEEEDKLFAEAEESYSRAVLIYTVKLGSTHPDLATAYHNLGTLYFDAGHRNLERGDALENKDEVIQTDFATAQENLEKALAIRKKRLGATHPSTANTQEALEACKKALSGDDTVASYVNDAEKMHDIFCAAYAAAGLALDATPETTQLQDSSSDLRKALQEASDTVGIDYPEETDFQGALLKLNITSETLMMSQVEAIFKEILQRCYM